MARLDEHKDGHALTLTVDLSHQSKEEVLRLLNSQLSRGEGPAAEFLAHHWEELVGDCEDAFEVDVVSEDDTGSQPLDGITQVVVVRQEGVSGRGSKAREEAGVQINRPPSISTGSPYLGKTSSRRLSRSASASGAASTPLSSTSSGLPVGPLAPAGNHTPRGTSSKELRHKDVAEVPPAGPRPRIQSSRARQPSASVSGKGEVSPATRAKPSPKVKSKVPSSSSAAASNERVAAAAADTIQREDSGGRDGGVRAWKSETTSTWFREKQKREEGNKLKVKRKEHETVLKDLEFIQSRRAARNDRAHEIKLGSPKHTYHVRRWTAACTIQRHTRRHFLEWTKTHAWRPRVTLHPEFRMQLVREYAGKDWTKHEVPHHLLIAWGVAPEAAGAQ